VLTPDTVNFTVGKVTYEVNYGLTWNEYIHFGATQQFVFDNYGYVMTADGAYLCHDVDKTQPVIWSDIIKPDAVYYTVSFS
jgi:adenylosuccinate lyase